jgi:single-strand DNA-binding protein
MSHPAEIHVTLIGTVSDVPEFAVCSNGVPRAGFRLTVPERRFDRAAALWTTSGSSHYSVVCWRTLAEHVGSSLGRGDPVIVTGRQRVVDRTRDGRRSTSVEVEAAAVGHDLRYGLSNFRAVARRCGPEPGPFESAGAPRARDPFKDPPAPDRDASERLLAPTKL